MQQDFEKIFHRSLAHQKRAHQVLPGAAHTYAKGDDQFPAHMTPVITRGEGCRVWDLDGNEFIEFGGGVRSVTLGHGRREVCDAAYQASLLGTNFARPAALELHATEKMLELIPRADMVKFAKNGSDAVTAAIKIARAYTGREMIAVCGDHPFFSVHDWFIATTPMNSGIPRDVGPQTVKFKYNDLHSVEKLFAEFPNQICAVVLEPEGTEPHRGDFLHQLRELAHRHGALFILDETITGFRWHNGGGQAVFDVEPDLSTFGKAMANGFSVSALCGKREFMQLLGTQHTEAERCFAMSLTHGAETSSLAAFMATAQIYQNEPIVERLYTQGKRLRDGVEQQIDAAGVRGHFNVAGRDCLLIYGTLDQHGQRSQEFRTLFLQELLKRGVLAPNFAVSAAHRDEDIDQTITAVGESLHIYANALKHGVERYLESRPVAPVFRKYNAPAFEAPRKREVA